MCAEPLIEVEALTHAYPTAADGTLVLRGIDLEVQRGERVALCGRSGCGKSTLMHVLGLLERPVSGRYVFRGERVDTCSPAEQARLRNQCIGFVFQQYHLLNHLSVYDNVALPLEYRRWPSSRRHERVMDQLERVGLADLAQRQPATLSGGQQQRVAMARACVAQPLLLLADEPTGALDSHHGAMILDLLTDMQAEQDLTVVLVTHDHEVASRCERTIDMKDGLLCG